jgi:hypothetical protein
MSVMKQLRFSTAQQVVEAFPTLREHISPQNTQLDPFSYIDTLLKADAARQAMAFCAYLLPRREAVQWTCWAFRNQASAPVDEDASFLELAEQWARKPTEQSRKAALDAGMKDPQRATAWAALSAGWSGGSIWSDGNQAVPMPQHLTGHAAFVAMSLLVAGLPFTSHTQVMEDIVAEAVSMLRRGDA